MLLGFCKGGSEWRQEERAKVEVISDVLKSIKAEGGGEAVECRPWWVARGWSQGRLPPLAISR